MEAMWINFTGLTGKKFAVRPYIGGVNGITGEASVGNMGRLLRQMNTGSRRQDYLVLPEQRWLDGIATSPGVVKQFVATHMATPRQNEDSAEKAERDVSKSNTIDRANNKTAEEKRPGGASIEWQVTGRDEVGGLQLHVIPQLDAAELFAGSAKNVCYSDKLGSFLRSSFSELPKDAKAYDILKTPEELGLKVGELIHIKDLKGRAESRSRVIQDLFDEAPMGATPQDVLELEARYYEGPLNLNVTVFNSSERPRRFSVSI
jgi:hypothetical protein